MKIKWKKKSKKITIFVGGVVIGILTTSLFFIILNAHNRYTNNKINNLIIAPYYEKSVFIKPTAFEAEAASPSAQIKIPILMYHYVEYVQDINDFIRKRLDINPYVFEKQLKTLKENNFHTYFVKDISDILDGKILYSSKSAILTFDDGYEDFYTVVFPLLKKYQIKATLYVVNNFIGRRGFLNKKQIEELIDSDLVEIGSHTLDHTYLKFISKSLVYKEIFESKKNLEKTFAINVKTFAYPYGAFTKETEELVKEASFSAAVSVIHGVLQSRENLFYLSRLRAAYFTGSEMVKLLESYKN